MIDLISSSVTLLSVSRIPSRRVISSMLRESSHTKGDVTLASTCIGRATSMVTRSALFMPMRLGTSSPKTIVR